MEFRKFEFTVLLIILLIVGSSLMFSWSLYSEHLKFSRFYFGTALIISSVILYMLIYRNKKKTFEYLDSLKFEDSLSGIKTNSSGNNNKLYNTINEIAKKYSSIKIEKESQYHYFQSIIKHISIGILSFDQNGKVGLKNEALLKTLHIEQINHISDLSKVKNDFPAILKEIKPSKNQLVRIEKEKGLLSLSVSASEFLIQGQKVKLISIQDIRNELQEQEIDAQQKLIRVLTHEIMNSVGPITSLSSTLLEEIEEAGNSLPGSFLPNAKIGLSAINKRSEGLGKFVEAYKSISKLPQPSFKEFNISELFEQVHALFKDEMDKESIELSFSQKDKNLHLIADEKMITQVFINLIKNAIESLKSTKNKKIEIEAFEDFNSNIHILISNNGSPIPNEIKDSIFLPFCTTKKDGSGIGLSLSRQIMHLHKGTINVKPDCFTTFQLIF